MVTTAYGLYLSLSSFVVAVETTMESATTMVADVAVDVTIANSYNKKVEDFPQLFFCLIILPNFILGINIICPHPVHFKR